MAMSIMSGPEAAENVLEAPGSVKVHDVEAGIQGDMTLPREME